MTRRLIARLLLFSFVGVAALVGIGLLYHDAIARALVLQLAGRIPGIETQIEGEIKVKPALPHAIEVDGKDLVFSGEALAGNRWRLGEVKVRLLLAPLLRGFVYLENLAISDADIVIPAELFSVGSGKRSAGGFQIPFVQTVRLRQIDFRVQLATGGPERRLSLERLEADMDEGAPIKLEGRGVLDGDPLSLRATLGNFKHFLQTREPYPVEVTFQVPAWGLEADVSGTLTHPLRLQGADLQLLSSVPDLTPLRDIVLPEAPFAGAATLRARLGGTWNALALSDLEATIDDGDRLRLTVAGAAEDVQARKGLDFRIEAGIGDPLVARYLLPQNPLQVHSVAFRSRVKSNGSAVRFENLEADAKGLHDLSATLEGAVEFSNAEASWTLDTVDLDVEASLATEGLDPWLPPAFSSTGTVSGRTRIEGSSRMLSFRDFDLTLQETEPVSGRIKGSFSYGAAQIRELENAPSLPAGLVPSEGEAWIDVETADLVAFGTLFGQPLPDLGAIGAKARLQLADGQDLRMTEVDVRTRGGRPLAVAATGELSISGLAGTPSLSQTDLALQAGGPGAAAAMPVLGPLPVDPGRWSLSARLQGPSEKLTVRNFAFESGSDDGLRFELEGSASDLNGLLASSGREPKGVAFKGRLSAESTAQLGPAIDKALPDLGRLNASFEGRGESGRWRLPKVAVVITDETGLDLRLDGQISELLRDLKYDASLTLKASSPQRTASRIGARFPPLAAASGKGRLWGDRSQANLDGRLDVGKTQFVLDLESELARPRAHLAGEITAPVILLRDFLSASGNSPSELRQADSRAATSKDVSDVLFLSRRPLPYEALRVIDLDLDLVADRVQGDSFKTGRFRLSVVSGQDYHRAELHEVRFEDGSAWLSLDVDTAKSPPEVAIQATGSNIALEALYADASDPRAVSEGRIGFDVDLSSRGRSPHELAAAADGRYGNVIENARLEGLNLDLLALTTLDLLTDALKDKRASEIECLVGIFKVEDGVAQTETMYVRTPKLRAVGSGHFDIGKETMDVVFNTESKKGLIKKKTALRIHGPIRNPTIDKDLSGVASGVAAGGAVAAGTVVVPMIALPAAGLSFFSGSSRKDKERPCNLDSLGEA